MAVTESTRPRLWVQLTAASDWLLAASQTQNQHQHQNQTRINGDSFASAAVNEVRA